MKKFLLAFLLSPLYVFAQDWVLIEENSNGSTRLFGERGSLLFGKTDQGVLVASARFSLVENGTRTIYFAATLVQSCAAGNGQMTVVAENSTQVSRFWWDKTGKRVFDVMAISICSAVDAARQQNSQPGQNPNSREKSI